MATFIGEIVAMPTVRLALLCTQVLGILAAVGFTAFCIRRRMWALIPVWLILGIFWVGMAYVNLRTAGATP